MKSSLRTKILSAILSIVFISNLLLGGIAIFISKKAMSPTVQSNIEHIARSVAVQFNETNNKEFRMLLTISSLNMIRDKNVSLKEKYDLISQVANIDKNFLTVSLFDESGKTYDSEGKLVDMSSSASYRAGMLGKKIITDPFFQNNKAVLMYTVPIFDRDWQPCGGVYATVKAEKLYDVCASLTVGKSSHPVIINMTNGIIIGDSDMEKIKNRTSLKESGSQEFLSIVSEMCLGKSSWGIYNDEYGKKMVCAYMPIGASCNWAVLCAAPYKDFFGTLNILIYVLIAMIVLADVAAIFVSRVVIKKALKPLNNVKKSINEIASGNADLTKRIKIESKDEIGDVVTGFNGFSEKMQSIISGVKESKELLSSAGESLVASISETSKSINDILDHIREVHSEIESQISEVGSTSSGVEDVATKVSKLKDMIENQAHSVEEASTSVEEMIGNIASVNKSMDKMASSFEELIASADDGTRLQKDVNDRIVQIDQQSQMLQTANQVIASIASQTNLLAMNAAIEAAHAGEAGSGFSVVADEIRKLSETSTAQSKQIGIQIKGIKSSIEGMVAASGQSTSAFANVMDKISETDELVRQIKGALEEQNEGSRQISEALSSMNDTTIYVREKSMEMMESNREILEEIQNLKGTSDRMALKMDEMKTGAKRIRETGENLSDISEKMEDSISEIGIQIDQFKV